MIKLNKGDRLFNEPNLEVYESKEYQDDDLVLVNKVGEFNPIYQYVAYYIKYGDYKKEEENN